MNKVRVRFLISVAGTGDPPREQLEQKYQRLKNQLTGNSLNAQKMGRPGRTDAEIDAMVNLERQKDAKIPRVSGFTHEFSFRPNDVAMIPAEIAQKWEEAGICIPETEASGQKKS